MRFNGKKWYHLIRITLAVVFIYASLDKIAHPQAFAQAVFNHQILPDCLVNLTALILPWMELVIGVCLLANIWMKGASVITAILMLMFLAIISFNLYRGLDVGCGCFSTSARENMNHLTFIRDGVFLILSFHLAFLAARA